MTSYREVLADTYDIDPDEHEGRDDLLYECYECFERWGAMGYLPPDYPESTGEFAPVACVDVPGSAFCEWCGVEGRPIL